MPSVVCYKKRSVIERLGGFRLQYKVYGDFDLIQRAYIAGFNFKETKSVISSFFVGGVSSDNISAEFERCRVMKTNKKHAVARIIDNKEYLLEDDIEALAYIQMTWVKGWVSNHVLYNI